MINVLSVEIHQLNNINMDIIDYKNQLTTIFGNSSTDQQISDAISMVLNADVTLSDEEKLEEMINLLIESGDSTFAQTNDYNSLDGAVGGVATNSNSQRKKHFNHLLQLFPDICPKFLEQFCQQYDPFDLDTVIEDLANSK